MINSEVRELVEPRVIYRRLFNHRGYVTSNCRVIKKDELERM
jgi:hypothetical protein